MKAASSLFLPFLMMVRIQSFLVQSIYPYRPTATRLFSSSLYTPRSDCWRPDVQDVERISFGKPAKQKGTGSRGVPHRLNSDERLLFDMARAKGLLVVAGSAWRSQRRDAPLLNTHRSLCDARGQACIVLHKGNQGIDVIVVDLSPLRVPEAFAEIAASVVENVNVEGATIMNPSNEDATMSEDAVEVAIPTDDPWRLRPIYQLPPYIVSWELERSHAKELGQKLVGLLGTAEGRRAPSVRPTGVKPGKSRQHGGYGIG
jgi:hypothetical protein